MNDSYVYLPVRNVIVCRICNDCLPWAFLEALKRTTSVLLVHLKNTGVYCWETKSCLDYITTEDQSYRTTSCKVFQNFNRKVHADLIIFMPRRIISVVNF